jgi:hypothetical protein
MQHIESSLEALNARIARLALALGLSLQNKKDMAWVMSRHDCSEPDPERRTQKELHSNSRLDFSGERRVSQTWNELRGLLVLRSDLQKHSVEQVGVVATRKLMDEAEESLERRGFEPGADGFDLDRPHEGG